MITRRGLLLGAAALAVPVLVKAAASTRIFTGRGTVWFNGCIVPPMDPLVILERGEEILTFDRPGDQIGDSFAEFMEHVQREIARSMGLSAAFLMNEANSQPLHSSARIMLENEIKDRRFRRWF